MSKRGINITGRGCIYKSVMEWADSVVPMPILFTPLNQGKEEKRAIGSSTPLPHYNNCGELLFIKELIGT